MYVNVYVSICFLCFFLWLVFPVSFVLFSFVFYLILLIIFNLDAYFYNNNGERKKDVNLGGWISGEALEELTERKP